MNQTGLLETNRKTLNLTGVRVTNQRALILGIIRQAEGHLDADEVYRQARQKYPRLSLSTVYRSLQLFKKIGLIDEVYFNESHHHYEAKPSAEHHHLICLGCGRVIEFHYPLSRYVKGNVAEARDFEIVATDIRMAGYCSKCRQSRK